MTDIKTLMIILGEALAVEELHYLVEYLLKVKVN